MCTRLFCNLSQAYVPIYLQDTLQMSPESVAYIPLTMYVSGFVTTLVMKPLNRNYGRKVSSTRLTMLNERFADDERATQ